MNKNLKSLLLISSLSLTSLISLSAFAQPASVTSAAGAQTQTSITSLKPEESKAGTFSLGLGIKYSQKVAVEEKSERESSTDFVLAPGYKINSVLSTSGKVVFSKENSKARQSSVSNTTVALGIKGIKLNQDFETLHSVTGIIPTNEDSIKEDRLKGGLSVSNGLRWVNPFVKVEYRLAVAKNVHEYTVNADGRPNIEYNFTNSLALTIPVTDKLSITTDGAYRIGRTYKGFQRNIFSVNADINYDIVDQLTINLGTSNDGDALKSNGVDSNIAAYNENSSVIRAGLTLSL